MSPGRPLASSLIFAGDVGGTKTHLALFDPGPPLRLVRLETFRSGSYPSIEAMLDAFLGDGAGPLAAAALGVAGPVVGETVVPPNVPWESGCGAEPPSMRRSSTRGASRRSWLEFRCG